MVVSSLLSNPNHDKYLAVLSRVEKGELQKAIAKEYEVQEGAISKWCSKARKILKERNLGESSGKSVESGKSTIPKKSSTKVPKKSTSKPKPSQKPVLDATQGDQDPDPKVDKEDEIEFEIPTQLKEMVKCAEYVCERVEKASFGDAIKFYDKTQMIENEEKDFEVGQVLLGIFEASVREFKELF